MNYLFFALVLLLCSCQSPPKPTLADTMATALLNIELIDTFDNELRLDTASHISDADFHTIYIGMPKDSIVLSYRWQETIYSDSEFFRKRMTRNTPPMRIYVDTTQIIGVMSRFALPAPTGCEKMYDQQGLWIYRKPIKAYPIFIKNLLDTDTIRVGYGYFLSLLIEAKDSIGNWRPIQKPYQYSCGTGMTYLHLLPKEILVTNCPLFEGDFKTTLRVVHQYKSLYPSNEFSGTINYNQFNTQD